MTERIDGVDVCEHHLIDFDELAERGVAVVVARAGRGTRQDARWIEHTRAAHRAGLHAGSYWHVSPSHTAPHHQAELWMLALRGVPHPFAAGHWADITVTDGLEPASLASYVAALLRRMDELLGRPVGVFTSESFWRRQVPFDIGDRPRWHSDGAWSPTAHGTRLRPADRGGAGCHQVSTRAMHSRLVTDRQRLDPLHLVTRNSHETADEWRRRWVRHPDVAVLQRQLNLLGADLCVDGVYGPMTDAAVHTWGLLRRRDCLLPSTARTGLL